MGIGSAAKAWETLRLVSPLLYQTLSGVIVQLPSAGTMASRSTTIWVPADLPALFSMARVAALTILCGVTICSATPIPAQCPARRCQGTE